MIKSNDKKSVVFWKEKDFIISKQLLDDMKYEALHNGDNKFRYCFHENEEDSMHEMLFTNTRDCYFRPHCHNEDEFQIVVDGKMYVIFFDKLGNIINVFKASKRKNNIYRINKEVWHMNLPITKTITIFEVKKGPFDKNSNSYPNWAPDNIENDKILVYKKEIQRKIKLYKKHLLTR